MPRRFWAAILEGTAWSLVGLCVVALLIDSRDAFGAWKPEANHGLFSADFSRRWDGGCSGWNRGESLKHLAGNVAHWWSYCTIAFVFWRLHPPMKTVPYSALTLTLVGWFIIGCGMGHLIGCLTMFLPMYRVEGYWLLYNGLVSVVSTFFVAYSLTKAFDFILIHREKIEVMRQELARFKGHE